MLTVACDSKHMHMGWCAESAGALTFMSLSAASRMRDACSCASQRSLASHSREAAAARSLSTTSSCCCEETDSGRVASSERHRHWVGSAGRGKAKFCDVTYMHVREPLLYVRVWNSGSGSELFAPVSVCPAKPASVPHAWPWPLPVPA
jgi:hypothetical protein